MKKEILEKMYSGVVKLSEQKIELGLVDDYNAIHKKSNESYDKYVTLMTSAKGFIQDALTSAKLTETQLKEEVTIYDNLVKMAKELGVDLPNNILQNKPSLALSETQKDINMLSNINSNLKVS